MPYAFSGYIRLPVRRLAFLGGVLLLCLSLFGSSLDAEDTADETTPASVAEYHATKSTSDYRVTLLGITKGVAFLDSEEPVADGARAHGNHAVPWMRIAMLVEQVGDKEAEDHPIRLQYQLYDTAGQDLVQPMMIEFRGNRIASRANGLAPMELDFQHLSQLTFPVAVPKVEKPDRARVFSITLSGDIRETDVAVLRLRLGKEPKSQELVFENVPIP